MNKKIFFGCLFILSWFYVSCSDDTPQKHDESTTLSVQVKEAGNLSQALDKYDVSRVTSLTIKGNMNARDFNYFKNNCTSVQHLDLHDVSIQAYHGKVGTNEGYDYQYSADEIPLGAFFYWVPIDEGMPSLKSVVLPDAAIAIRRNAFARAYNLTEVKLPESLVEIDYVAFAICTSLKTISFPAALQEIGEAAFQDCAKLETVHIKAQNPPALGDNAFTKIKKGAKLYVPKDCYQRYKDSDWSDYFVVIEEE